MKKIFIIMISVLAVVAFFYPKFKYFNCGGIVCQPETYEKTKKEIDSTVCLGFETSAPTFTESTGKGCFGIFLKK